MSGYWNCVIDWLTLTIVGAYGAIIDVVANVDDAVLVARLAVENLGIAVAPSLVIVRPDFGYAYGFVHSETGIRVDVGWKLSHQGIKVTGSGKSLRNHGDAKGLLSTALDAGWKPTRVDVAWDMFNSAASIGQIQQQVTGTPGHQPRYKTGYIASRTGETLTIGSRTSQKYVRIYDKAAEQGVSGDWKRIEIELKGAFLQENAREISLEPCIMGHTVLDMLQGAETPLDALLRESLTDETPNKVSGSLDPMSSKLRWLERSVMPSLMRLYREDTAQWREFVDMLQSGMNAVDQNKEV